MNTKSVDALVEIMHHQYIQRMKNKQEKFDEEEFNQSPDTDYQNTFLIKLFKTLPNYNTDIMEEVINKKNF